MRKEVRIKFTNGLTFKDSVKDILGCVSQFYDFVDSYRPDYLIFGPYGNDIPQGAFTRIGYFCENMRPNMAICDWAFGMRYEEEVNNPRYARIQWHGFDPSALIKSDINVDEVISRKTRFCNFVFSNPVAFRERFFTRLSQYKQVDAPGRCMNNTPPIDAANDSVGGIWDRKRTFISQYKFTIAFENSSYPGYHTEKILDPMTVQSLPIYWGNPNIERHFNTRSFINTHEDLTARRSFAVRTLDANCQRELPSPENGFLNNLKFRVSQKLKHAGQIAKTKIQYGGDFDQLIERIVEIDQNDSLYASYLAEPWYKDNRPPSNEHIVKRWREIFG